MSDISNDAPSSRWATLSREVQELEGALNGCTLVGVLDRDTNYIASMQEEIDRKTRQALVAYWLGVKHGKLPETVD